MSRHLRSGSKHPRHVVRQVNAIKEQPADALATNALSMKRRWRKRRCCWISSHRDRCHEHT